MAEGPSTGDSVRVALRCVACGTLASDPRRLPCLHLYCASHEPADKSASDDVAEHSGRYREVFECPLCPGSVETPARSSFVEGLAAFGRLKVLDEGCAGDDVSGTYPCCGFAAPWSDGNECGMNYFWCHHCARFYCKRCLPAPGAHSNEHQLESVAGVPKWRDFAAMAANRCVSHRSPLHFMCFTCSVPKCDLCMQVCLDERHEAYSLTSPVVKRHVGKVRRKIDSLCRHLKAEQSPVELNTRLRVASGESRKSSQKILVGNKTKILSSIESAFQEVEKNLHERHEKCEEQLAEHLEASNNHQRAKEHALAYSELVADADGDVCLLQQYEAILSCLTLLKRQSSMLCGSTTRGTVVTSAVCEVSQELSSTMKNQIGEWLGKSEQMPELFNMKDYCSLLSYGIRNAEAKTKSLDVQTATDPYRDGCLEEISRLLTLKNSFDVAIGCADISLLPDGSVVLAAGPRGMLEYCRAGRQLSSWSPVSVAPSAHRAALSKDTPRGEHRREYVSTIEALEDGRVVVGLPYSQRAVVLKRLASAPDKWTEDKVISELGISAESCLAVFGNLLVTSGLSTNDHKKRSQLVIALWFDSSDSKPKDIIRQELHYTISSVAVTGKFVIAASKNAIEAENPGGTNNYVIDCYSHVALFIWRQLYSEPVTDVAIASSGKVIYLTQTESRRILAIMTEDGSQLREVAAGFSSPARLSLSKGGSHILGVLDGQKFSPKSVAIFGDKNENSAKSEEGTHAPATVNELGAP